MMIVMGIDPGTATTGYGVVIRDGSRLRHVTHGVIATPANTPFADRLSAIYDEITALLDTHKPQAVAIEKIFFKQNITTGISVAQARGVIALACAQRNLDISEYGPVEVKNGVVGYGKATKQQVQQMTKTLLTLDDIPRPDDAADALALAICRLHSPNHLEAQR